MAPPFDRLSVELVDEIFEWLCPYCAPVGFANFQGTYGFLPGFDKYDRAGALLQLTRTCRRLNAVAKPHPDPRRKNGQHPAALKFSLRVSTISKFSINIGHPTS